MKYLALLCVLTGCTALPAQQAPTQTPIWVSPDGQLKVYEFNSVVENRQGTHYDRCYVAVGHWYPGMTSALSCE